MEQPLEHRTANVRLRTLMEQPLEHRTANVRLRTLMEQPLEHRTVFQRVLSLAVISAHERLEKTGRYSKEFFH